MKVNLTQKTDQIKLSELKPGEYFWFNNYLYLLVKCDIVESPESGVFVLFIKTNSLRTFSVKTQVYRENRSLVLNLEN